MHLGYLAASGIFLITFALAVWAQVHATRFHAYLYWFAIIASTLEQCVRQDDPELDKAKLEKLFLSLA